ncbi:MAG: glycosyltransferase family 2 protein [Acidimicrobiia bacterium]|nr:glycosyltransferase family 2 protein [Acidimicrobiia bacterium]
MNGHGRPSFSCILPTYNRCDVVEQTLRQLLACDYPGDRYEILVADNSTDGTPEMVERVARRAAVPVRLLRSSHRLPAVKRNEAVRAATGDLVLFMNDDVWVREDFLAEHERAHQLHPGPVAVLGHVEQSPRMPRDPFIEWYRPFAYHEIADRAGEPLDWRYFWTMNLSLPRSEMLERNLLFHEDWAEIGSEDVELGYRWVSAGDRLVYHPEAWGEHYHPHSLDSACRLQETIGRGLRDLEVLVPERDLLERYGVFSLRNRPRAVARGLARMALFNAVTVPPVQRRLSRIESNTRLSRWLYWKVLSHHTNRGYREAPTRHPVPLVTRPRAEAQVGS